jgi:hypothetical protein
MFVAYLKPGKKGVHFFDRFAEQLDQRALDAGVLDP